MRELKWRADVLDFQKWLHTAWISMWAANPHLQKQLSYKDFLPKFILDKLDTDKKNKLEDLPLNLTREEAFAAWRKYLKENP